MITHSRAFRYSPQPEVKLHLPSCNDMKHTAITTQKWIQDNTVTELERIYKEERENITTFGCAKP